MPTKPPRPPVAAHLTADDAGEDFVGLTVVGGLAASRGVELWSDLEEALERAAGRLVVVDLRRVTGFDVNTLDSLARVGRAARRRRVDICALMNHSSALGQYARICGVHTLLPIYDSLPSALVGCCAEPV